MKDNGVPLMDVREDHELWEELGDVVTDDLGYTKAKLSDAAK